MTVYEALHARVAAALAAAEMAQASGTGRSEAMELLVRESTEVRRRLFASELLPASDLRREWEPWLNAMTTAYYQLSQAK